MELMAEQPRKRHRLFVVCAGTVKFAPGLESFAATVVGRGVPRVRADARGYSLWPRAIKALLTGRIQKCKTNPSIAHIGLATHGRSIQTWF